MQALSRLWASGFGERLANQIKVLEPSCTAFSIMSPSGQNRFLTQNPRGTPAETAHPADPVQWLQRRSRAERGTRGREGAIPYTTLKEPEPWSVIHARLMVHAVRNRPQNKRRMVWDRHIAREKQKMTCVHRAGPSDSFLQKNAWTVQYNSWRNQQLAKRDAHVRWQARREMQAAENNGRYAYEEQEHKQRLRTSQMTRYRQHRYYKPGRGEDEDKDLLLDEPQPSEPVSVPPGEVLQLPDTEQRRRRVERTL